jgi:hypothetical protein
MARSWLTNLARLSNESCYGWRFNLAPKKQFSQKKQTTDRKTPAGMIANMAWNRFFRWVPICWHWLFRKDIFICYSRQDYGSVYAHAVAVRLQKDFRVLMDTLEARPGTSTPQPLLDQLPYCRQLIVIGSPGSFASTEMTDEVRRFPKSSRSIILIQFETSVRNALWYAPVEGLEAAVREPAGARAPSDESVEFIRHAFMFTRQRHRERWAVASVLAAVFAILGVAFLIRSQLLTQNEVLSQNVRENIVKLGKATKEAGNAQSRAMDEQQIGDARREANRIAQLRTVRGVTPFSELPNAVKAAERLQKAGLFVEATHAVSEALAATPEFEGTIEATWTAQPVVSTIDYRILLPDGNKIHQWNYQNWKPAGRDLEFPQPVFSLQTDDRFQTIVAVDREGVEIWHGKLFSYPHCTPGAVSRSGRWVALPCEAGGKLIDLETPKAWDIDIPVRFAGSLEFSRDEHELYIFDGANHLGETPHPQSLTRVTLSDRSRTNVQSDCVGSGRAALMQPDAVLLAGVLSGSDREPGREVRVCRPGDPAIQNITTTFYGIPEERAFQLNRTGNALAMRGSDDRLRIWDLATGDLTRTLPGLQSAPFSFTADGRYLLENLNGTELDKAWMVDVQTGRLACALPAYGQPSFDGRYFLVGASMSTSSRAEEGLRGTHGKAVIERWTCNPLQRSTGLPVDGGVENIQVSYAADRVLVASGTSNNKGENTTEFNLFDIGSGRVLVTRQDAVLGGGSGVALNSITGEWAEYEAPPLKPETGKPENPYMRDPFYKVGRIMLPGAKPVEVPWRPLIFWVASRGLTVGRMDSSEEIDLLEEPGFRVWKRLSGEYSASPGIAGFSQLWNEKESKLIDVSTGRVIPQIPYLKAVTKASPGTYRIAQCDDTHSTVLEVSPVGRKQLFQRAGSCDVAAISSDGMAVAWGNKAKLEIFDIGKNQAMADRDIDDDITCLAFDQLGRVVIGTAGHVEFWFWNLSPLLNASRHVLAHNSHSPATKAIWTQP